MASTSWTVFSDYPYHFRKYRTFSNKDQSAYAAGPQAPMTVKILEGRWMLSEQSRSMVDDSAQGPDGGGYERCILVGFEATVRPTYPSPLGI